MSEVSVKAHPEPNSNAIDVTESGTYPKTASQKQRRMEAQSRVTLRVLKIAPPRST